MEKNDRIEASPVGGDSFEMRLLTRAVAEDKDVTLCTAAGPLNNSSSHHGHDGRCLMLCRCRDLRKGRASSSSTRVRQCHEREQFNRVETHLARSGRQVGSTVMNFRELLLSYLEYTSAHGLPRAARSSSLVRRVLWIGTFVFFVAYFVYQFIALLTMFYNFPIGVKIVIEQKRVIEFPAVTVCNLNIMKVSRISEDPKYRNLGRIDNKIKRQVEHLLSALNLDEMKHSTDPDASGHDEDDYETYTRRGEDARPGMEKPDGTSPRSEWTPPNGELPDVAKNNRNSTEDASSSNATARGLTARETKPVKINTTSMESRAAQTLIDALLLNKRNAEFKHDNSRNLNDFKYLDNNFGAVSNDYEFDQLMSHSMTSDYSDMFDLLKPSSEDLEKYGHKAQDFIIQCSMDSRNCSYRDFQRRESIDFGNCYTFNHGSGDSNLILSSKYGSRYGLRLTLNIEHDEYLGLFSQKAGVRVAIHPYNIPPFPEDFGLNASPGSETEIGVTMESVRRLPYPYPTNCTDRRMYHSSMPWDREGLYTVMSCIKSCLQRKMERYCGCVDSEVTSVESVVLRCLSTNSTQDFMKPTSAKEPPMMEGTVPLAGPHDAAEPARTTADEYASEPHGLAESVTFSREIIYKTTISSTVWPSEPYANLLASALMDENRFFRKSDIFRSIKRNLASIHIYLADMNIKQIDEYPSYPWDRLLADIGGMLGLFVGISACTVMELVEFLFDVILLSFRKCRT